MFPAEVCPNLITDDEAENPKSPTSTPKDDSLGPIEEVDGNLSYYFIYSFEICLF